jgi:hypothetical protein
MDHSWIEKILTGLIILVLVIFGMLRFAAGMAGAAALRHFPISMLPARLRRFFFGERNDTAHRPNI